MAPTDRAQRALRPERRRHEYAASKTKRRDTAVDAPIARWVGGMSKRVKKNSKCTRRENAPGDPRPSNWPGDTEQHAEA